MTNTTHHLNVQQLTNNLLNELTHATEHQDRNAYLAALATCHTAHIPDTDIHTAWHTGAHHLTAPTFDWAGIDTLAPQAARTQPGQPYIHHITDHINHLIDENMPR